MHTCTIPGPYVTQGRHGSLAVNLPCAQGPMLLPGIHQALLTHPSPIFPDRKGSSHTWVHSHLQLSPIWSGSSLSDSGTHHSDKLNSDLGEAEPLPVSSCPHKLISWVSLGWRQVYTSSSALRVKISGSKILNMVPNSMSVPTEVAQRGLSRCAC